MDEPNESDGPVSPDRIPLHQDDTRQRRRRAVSGLVGVLIFAAAAGGIAGLIGGLLPGLIAAGVVGGLLLYVVVYNLRRRLWLQGNTLLVRTWRTTPIDLATAKQIDLLVTDVRGTRTIGLLITPASRRKAVKLDLAVYAGTGGRELGILPLRALANALLNNVEANGVVFAELLVAELRAEAKGEATSDRPLYRLASAAPAGKLAQRFTMDVVSRFVANLD